MDGLDGGSRRRKSFKERLGLKGMGCCGGATWGIRPSTLSVRDDDYDLELEDESPSQQEEEEEEEPNQNQQIEAVRVDVGQTPPENISDPDCDGQIPAGSGMNLATALAAERQFRATQESDGTSVVGPTSTTPNRDGPSVGTAPGTPLRVSLMRLLEESDGGDGDAAKEKDLGSDSLCCVCMGRKKGAAFIPCGHTFCRVCSRELWLNRASCPLCNRSILEILDIF